MQVGQVTSSRAYWYDRSLLVTGFYFNGVLPVHAESIRGTYTVPANKKAWLTFARISMYRSVATTGSSLGMIRLYHTPLAGIAEIAIELISLDTALYANKSEDLYTRTLLTAGDTIYVTTMDVSPDGSFRFLIKVIINEYDA